MKRFSLLKSIFGIFGGGAALAAIPRSEVIAQEHPPGSGHFVLLLADDLKAVRAEVFNDLVVKGGIDASAKTYAAVIGTSDARHGVEGHSTLVSGVLGTSKNGPGVTGQTASSSEPGILGIGHRAALFEGNVGVNGIFAVHGFKSFKIDHPLDPSGAYLSHASIESSEVLNLYSGNCVLDARGKAEVILPRWFEALNEDFRYQLSSIGAPNPNVYVKRPVGHGSFAIAGGTPRSTISWQITGKRRDAWVKDHPLVVEEPKTAAERGTYLHPESFGQPQEKSLMWRQFPEYMRRDTLH